MRPGPKPSAALTAAEQMSEGIRGAVRSRLVEDMFKAVSPGQKVLIVDKPAAEILNSVLRLHDLIELEVPLIESITNVRQPLPMAAIYFVAPTESTRRAFAGTSASSFSQAGRYRFLDQRNPGARVSGSKSDVGRARLSPSRETACTCSTNSPSGSPMLRKYLLAR